jgi:hypothetical protein
MIHDKSAPADGFKNTGWPLLRKHQFQTRTLMLAIMLAAVWMGLLVDPSIGPLVLLLSGAFALTLLVMAIAIGLGLVGFGVCSVCDRAIGWLRRTSQWPDEQAAAAGLQEKLNPLTGGATQRADS